MFKDEIQWNFAKFLVDQNGVIINRYYPTTSPLTIEVYLLTNHVFSRLMVSDHVVYNKSRDGLLDVLK